MAGMGTHLVRCDYDGTRLRALFVAAATEDIDLFEFEARVTDAHGRVVETLKLYSTDALQWTPPCHVDGPVTVATDDPRVQMEVVR
jgi:hypothetical protein